MKTSIHTSDYRDWLNNKSKCPNPKCKSKDRFINHGHNFTNMVAYLRCTKCEHTWDVVPLVKQ